MRCSHPMLINNPKYKIQGYDRITPVRCGKCEGCLKSRINDWAFRLEQEAKRNIYVHFVTLTYSPEFVPLTPSLLHTLEKTDVQKFLKRLRKRNGRKIKYFAVGEYGTRTYRPHYHIILFNVDSDSDIRESWKIKGKEIGGVHIGNSIDSGAIPYTLKYMFKKGLVPSFYEDDRKPEFRLMSKKMGDNYLTKNIIKWHLDDLDRRQYVLTKNGIKIAMPRYYREQLIETEEFKKSGYSKFIFQDDETVFMVEDENDFRTLKSKIQNKKTNIEKFRAKRNQQNRSKI